MTRQWFKSRVGFDAGEMPREYAFCTHAMQGHELFVVPDALDDDRFRDNPCVSGAPFVRFYAGIPLAASDGYPLGTLCVFDHTPRTLTVQQRGMMTWLGRQVEGLLKTRLARLQLEQESLYHEAILRSAGSAIISVNEQGIIKLFNPEAERMLGYRAEEVIDQLGPGAIHDAAEVSARAAELSRELGRVIEPGFEVFVAKPRSGETETREWTYVRKDGSRFPVLLSVTALRNSTGELVRFLGIARDITARKAAAEALRHSEAYNRSILQSWSDCLKVLNLEGRLQDMAGPGQRLLGVRDFESIRNADWLRFWPRDEDQAAVRHALAEARAGGTNRFTGLAPTMDGTPKWRDVIVSPILGEDGRPEAVLAVLRDITLRHEAEEKLRDLNATLEERVVERTAALQAERAFTEGQTDVLKMVAARQPMAATLDALARLIESQADGVAASILVVDETGGCLRHGAAPNLPPAYNTAVDGMPVGPKAGSCGTAAARREPVIVEDISTDPLWDDYRALALPLGLRACWSIPIFDDRQRVLGTFALYHRRPALPQPEHLHLIENAAQVASITLIDVEISSHPLAFDGRWAELVLAHDVTARKKAETDLRESEERLRLALDAAQMGTFDWIPATNHIKWTPRHEVLWGFQAGEFDGTYEAFASRLHPEDRAGIGAELSRCIAAREPFAAEFRVIWPDASVHWIRSQGKFTFDAAGHPLRMLGLVTEITHLKRAEAALRETEALYRTVFEQAPAGGVLIDPATQQMVQFNDFAAKQLGYTREEFARLTVADIEGHEQPADTRQRIERILRTGGDDFETIHRTRRGDRRNVLVSVRTVESAGRKLCYCVFRDITERLAQEKVERRSQRLESIGILAGGVAHDLNNSLAPILMSVNLLKALHPRETEILDTMETSVRRAAGMVRQLLTFAKGSEGARVAINVRYLIKEICDILGPTFPKNIRLESRCPRICPRSWATRPSCTRCS